RGWRTLAAEVDGVLAALRKEGVEPLLAGSNWSLPGELGFYCAGHPAVYSLGPPLGDRHSQYDLWHPNPVGDPASLVGRTSGLVGIYDPKLYAAFDQVEPPRTILHVAHGHRVAVWGLTVCRGFKGFPVAEGLREKRTY